MSLLVQGQLLILIYWVSKHIQNPSMCLFGGEKNQVRAHARCFAVEDPRKQGHVLRGQNNLLSKNTGVPNKLFKLFMWLWEKQKKRNRR